MQHVSLRCGLLAILITASIASVTIADDAAEKLTLKTQQRIRADQTPKSFTVKQKNVEWAPEETAIVIVDMWDDHHCKSAAKRVVEMAPHVDRTVKAARARGILIIHAPSSCMDFYAEAPARKKMATLEKVSTEVPFRWNNFNPEGEGALATKLEAGGCSCDTDKPCSPSYRAWKRQIAAIEIKDHDAISDDGQEIYNLLQDRGIKNVILLGVHTNRCVLGRPFGIRQMVYLGKNVVLCRDLTDSYHRDPGQHFEGLNQIIAHVEKYWCPTITSSDLTGKPPFRFQADKTDHAEDAP